jgi:hypothetical protein
MYADETKHSHIVFSIIRKKQNFPSVFGEI